MSEEYNGWPNRETWAASLHLDNDYGTYSMVREHLAELAEYPEDVDRSTLTQFADYLKELVTELCDPDGEYGDCEWGRLARGDIGSLWRVDWRSIAESIASEVPVYVGTISMAGYLPESDPFYSLGDPDVVRDHLRKELERGSEDDDGFNESEVIEAMQELDSWSDREGAVFVRYRSGHLVYEWSETSLKELMTS